MFQNTLVLNILNAFLSVSYKYFWSDIKKKGNTTQIYKHE